MDIKKISSISGASANSLGQIKFPDCVAKMPRGGERTYRTKWIWGVKYRSSKTARHVYFGVRYRGKNYKIHRLVCEAFHGPPPFAGAVVIHVDEDALNNCPENLKWGTQKENLNMPGFIEYCKSRTGKDSPSTKGRLRKDLAR